MTVKRPDSILGPPLLLVLISRVKLPLVCSTPPLRTRKLADGKPVPSSACKVGRPVLTVLPPIWVVPPYLLFPVKTSVPLTRFPDVIVRFESAAPARLSTIILAVVNDPLPTVNVLVVVEPNVKFVKVVG